MNYPPSQTNLQGLTDLATASTGLKKKAKLVLALAKNIIL
jgi:hypothetical protein